MIRLVCTVNVMQKALNKYFYLFVVLGFLGGIAARLRVYLPVFFSFFTVH